MSFDLYREEVDNRLASLRPVTAPEPEPGMFDNFFSGTGKMAMQTFAKAGRAASMAAAPLAMALEKAPGSTEMQDKFFKAHDETFGRAVDYWTPKAGEVGTAGQITGQLLATLPMVVASPALAVAQTQMATGEDLVRKGVDAGKAQAVGAAQAAGLGLGIWVPILGKTLAQRVLLGGAGFNATQGVATRAASAKILEGTAAGGDFKAFDPTALTLDVLLGAAFGGIAHLNPRMRAEGEAWQKRLTEWGRNLKPSEVDALATMRQAQHLNADSMPGKPVDVVDINAHVVRMRQAIDDLVNDRPVQVENMPAGRFDADPARQAEAENALAGWEAESEAARAARAADDAEATVSAAVMHQNDDAAFIKEAERIVNEHAERQPDASAKADGRGQADQSAPGQPGAAARQTGADETASLDPLAAEALRFADENPDLPIAIGKNADGSDIVTTPRQWIEDADATMRQAQDDARLFEIAAGCLLGGGR